jgi:hypothetical protein
MPDEIALTKDASRGIRAKSLLENELLTEAFQALEDSYIAFWRATRPEDELGREKAYIAINVIGKVRQHLQTVVNDGKLAQAELNKLRDDFDRKKRFGII